MANYICQSCEYTKSTRYYEERIRCPECGDWMEYTDEKIDDDWEENMADYKMMENK